MTSLASTIVLVTGASQVEMCNCHDPPLTMAKGIGKGFVQSYLQRPNTIVIAGVRAPESPTAHHLSNVERALGSRLITATINATSDTDAKNAVQTLMSQHGIDRLDIVIANAGIFDPAACQKVADMKLANLQEHIEVNTYGVIRLFQATRPLLDKSEKPIFLLNSAGAGSIGGLGAGSGILPHFPLVSYAASKLLANFFVLRLKHEHPKLIAFALHPGSVVTPNRTAAAKKLGVPVEGMSVDESVSRMLSILDNATLETTSGTFLDVDGIEIPW